MYFDLAKLIKESNQIVFLSGAGVSTESGIPDFRSSSGLYNDNYIYGTSPEDILSHSYFMHKPKEFFEYYKENLVHPDAKPNSAHYAIARLERFGKLKAVVTQNIDGLHQAAGSKNVLELHGSIHRNRCMTCDEPFSLAYIMDNSNCINGVPLCNKCQGTIRPDIVLYDEELDSGVLESAQKAISMADLLIVGGTSLVVYPAAGLLDYYSGQNLVLINNQSTPYDRYATMVFHESVGKVLAGATETL